MISCSRTSIPRTIFFFFVIIGSIVVAGAKTNVFAENPQKSSGQQVEIQGLTFACDDCRLSVDLPCSVTFVSENLLLSCDEATKKLLIKTLSTDYNGSAPSPSELRRYLLREHISEAEAEVAVKLLLANENGAKVLILEAPTLVLRFQSLLTKLFSERNIPPEVLSAYWKLPTTEGIVLSSALRAVIVAKDPKLSLDDLLGDLSAQDLDKDLAELSIFESELRKFKTDWVDGIGFAIKQLKPCVETLSDVNYVCTAEVFDRVPVAVKNYIERAKLKRMIHLINRDKPLPDKVFSLFKRVDYQTKRSPELHEIILAAIDNTFNAAESIRFVVAGAENWPMISVFAANDKRIAFSYAKLLTRISAIYWEKRQYQKAVDILAGSYSFYSERIVEREEIFGTIASAQILSREPGLKAKVEEIARIFISDKTERGFSVYSLLTIAFLSFALFVVLTLIIRNKRMAREAYYQDVVAVSEAEELRGLCSFFGISFDASEVELTKSFHRMAKESHPDAVRGEDERFKTLSGNYQRARELLSRREQFSGGTN